MASKSKPTFGTPRKADNVQDQRHEQYGSLAVYPAYQDADKGRNAKEHDKDTVQLGDVRDRSGELCRHLGEGWNLLRRL